MTNPLYDEESEGTPALTRLLGQDGGEMPPPTTCENCPFGQADPQEKAESQDWAELHYQCKLLGGQKVWGETPRCTIGDWQQRAQKEHENE